MAFTTEQLNIVREKLKAGGTYGGSFNESAALIFRQLQDPALRASLLEPQFNQETGKFDKESPYKKLIPLIESGEVTADNIGIELAKLNLLEEGITDFTVTDEEREALKYAFTDGKTIEPEPWEEEHFDVSNWQTPDQPDVQIGGGSGTPGQGTTGGSGWTFDDQNNLVSPSGQRISPSDPSYDIIVGQQGLTPPSSDGGAGGNITMPNGQIISPGDPNYDTFAGYVEEGRPGYGYSTPEDQAGLPEGATETTPPTSGDMIADDWDVDMTGWPPEWVTAWNAMVDQLKVLEDLGKTVNPDIEITEETLAEFDQIIFDNLDPKFQQDLKIAKEKYEQGLDLIAQNRAAQLATDERDFVNRLQNERANLAENGLIYSGIRGKKELGMKTAEESRQAGIQRELAANMDSFSESYEQYVGSDRMDLWNTPEVGGFGGVNIGLDPGFQPGAPGVPTGGFDTGIEYGQIDIQRKLDEEAQRKELIGLHGEGIGIDLM